MDAIIFDIDGTLADVSHRRKHISGGKRDWKSFFEEMVNDPPLENMCYLATLISDGSFARDCDLFFFSGRPDTYRKETEEWLSVHASSYYDRSTGLHMRAGGDYRPDTEIKREMLHALQAQGYTVKFVVDDRPSVIKMWKEEGLTVLEHDSGEWDTPVTTEPGHLNLMIGPSGAGKTTYLKSLRNPNMIISSDDLRDQFTGDPLDQSRNDEMWAAFHALIKTRIRAGLDTYVDATNLRAANRRKIRDLTPSNTDIIYTIIDRPLEDKIRDGGWRNEVMIKGETLINRHHQSFQSGKKFILAGDSDPRVTILDLRETK